MHVLLIPKWYPGRHDPQLGDFIRKQALAAADHVTMSVLFVAPTDPDSPMREAEVDERDGAHELRLYYRGCTRGWRPWRKLVNLMRYGQAVTAGMDRIRRDRGIPDLVHAYILVRPVMVARWLKWKYGIPYLISEQSSEYLDGTYARKGRVFAWWNRYLFKGASGVTAVSSWLGDRLVQLGLTTGYDVVPNVVPGLDRPLPPPGRPGRFMMVADLVDRTKNVSGVIRALARARAHNADMELTVVGDGPDRKALEQLAITSGVERSVRFLGRLPNSEVLDLVADAFALVINSRVETFSVVTGEALAQGKPVIATRCGGPQAFVNDTNGLLIDVDDEAGLANALLEMAAHPERFDPQVIRDGVHHKFSPEAVGRAFTTIYTRLAHANG